MQYHHLQNYTIITCYNYYGILISGQRNVPNLFLRKVLLVNLLQSDKAWQESAQQAEKSYTHTHSAVSRQVYVHALLVQHLYSVFFQYIVWHGPTSESASIQRRQKIWLKYTDFTDLKKITSRTHSNCSNYSFLYFKSFKFRCYSFCFIKTNLQLYKCAAYFTFHFVVHFFKGKIKSGIFGGFYCFFKWAFKTKTNDFFWLGPIT